MRTAMEDLLKQAGYSNRRSTVMADWIDHAGIRGMSADDLYSAFMRWKRKQRISERAVKRLGKIGHPPTEKAIDQIRKEVIDMAEEARKYQQLFPFASQPETYDVKARTPEDGDAPF